MSKNQASSIIIASMLTIALTLGLSRGWAKSVTDFIEGKINDPKEPGKPTPSTAGASGQSGFDNGSAGGGGGGGGGGSWISDQPNFLALRECESSGNYRAIDPTGTYFGAYQFDLPTWQSVGGTGLPSNASVSVQDSMALKLYNQRGKAPWPVCGEYL